MAGVDGEQFLVEQVHVLRHGHAQLVVVAPDGVDVSADELDLRAVDVDDVLEVGCDVALVHDVLAQLGVHGVQPPAGVLLEVAQLQVQRVQLARRLGLEVADLLLDGGDEFVRALQVVLNLIVHLRGAVKVALMIRSALLAMTRIF